MRGTLTAGVAAAVALAGCGGGDSGGGDSGKTTTVPAGKPLAVTAKEYSFNPGSIVVSSGGKGSTTVQIQLKNEGAQAHDLHVERGGDDLGGTPIFGPGQTKSAGVSLTPGTYDIVCTVGDHEALGMKGKLVVK